MAGPFLRLLGADHCNSFKTVRRSISTDYKALMCVIETFEIDLASALRQFVLLSSCPILGPCILIGCQCGTGVSYSLGIAVFGRAISSPMERCVATASAIMRGGGVVGEIPVTQAWGVPGAFVEDPTLTGPQFLALGPMEVIRRQLQGWELLGMRERSVAREALGLRGRGFATPEVGEG